MVEPMWIDMYVNTMINANTWFTVCCGPADFPCFGMHLIDSVCVKDDILRKRRQLHMYVELEKQLQNLARLEDMASRCVVEDPVVPPGLRSYNIISFIS